MAEDPTAPADPADAATDRLAEEAGRFVGAVQAWARQMFPAPADAPRADATPADNPIAGDRSGTSWAGTARAGEGAETHAHTPGGVAPGCSWCPLCQFVAVLRGDRPEVTARVAEAGTAIASAFRALLESVPAPAPAADPRPAATDTTDRADASHGADPDPSAAGQRPGAARRPASGPEGAAPRVQRIDLGGPGADDAS